MAAAYTTLFAYGLMMILSYIIGQKYYPVPYNVPRILFYILLAIGLSFVALHTNQNYYINTLLVLVFLSITAILERNELKQLLKK